MNFAKPRNLLGWIISVLSLIFCLIIVTALIYIIIPVDSDGLGRFGLIALVIPFSFLLAAAVCFILLLWAKWKGWRLAVIFLEISIVLSVFISFWPSIVLWRKAGSFHASLDIGEALVFKFNKADSSLRKSVSYATAPDGRRLMLDIWVPDSLLQGPPRAAIVKIHGGGWVQGNKDDLTAWDKWFSELGYPVFDVEYRMSSTERWQDETGDVKAALGWVSAHAAEFNVNPARIITMGNSAGANLALLSAYSYNDPQLPPSFNMPVVKVKCVIDIYGPSDMAAQYSTTGSPNYVRPLMREYVGGSPAEFPDRYQLLSPIRHVGPGSPPTIIFQGEYDRIVPKFQSIRLNEALEKSGVPHELWLLPLSDHVFDANWTFFSTQIARQKIQAFLEKYGT